MGATQLLMALAPGMSIQEVAERHRELVETDWMLWAEEFIEAEWGDTKVRSN